VSNRRSSQPAEICGCPPSIKSVKTYPSRTERILNVLQPMRRSEVLGALTAGLVEWKRTISGNLRRLIAVLWLSVLLVVVRVALPVSEPPELLAQETVARGEQTRINCGDGPLSLEGFMKLVPDVEPPRLRAYIDKCTLGFAFNESLRQRLAAAKVPPDLIAYIREHAQSGSTAVRPGGAATLAPPSGEPRAGDLWVNPKDGLTYVGIPAGSFRMGCTKGDSECYGNEKNDHDVTLTHGFWMGQTEVTFAAYSKKADPHATPDQYSGRAKVGPQYPVFNVTWQDAADYCRWSLGSRGGLPTEAQWEYAARSTAKYSPRYGPLADIAWIDSGNRTQTSHEVKQLRPNAWGLYDMLGNVWEWTNDWYVQDYPKTPQADPTGPSSGDQRWFFGPTRVVRGGGWVSSGRGARASDRDTDAWPGDRVVDIGFRCVGEAISLNK